MPEVRTCLDLHPPARQNAQATGQRVPSASAAANYRKSRLPARLFLGVLLLGSCGSQNQPPDASVVQIIVPGGHGSGFVLNRNGDVVTAFHLIEQFAGHPDQITVIETSPEAGAEHPVGWFRRVSPELDLAIIHADGLDQPPARLLIGDLRTGDPVYAVGFLFRPADPDASRPEPRVAGGTVTRIAGAAGQRTGQSPPAVGVIAHNAVFEPGNSGAPLVNACGAVVGINTLDGVEAAERHQGTSQSPPTRRASFAIDVSALKPALDKWHIPYQTAAADCRGSASRTGTYLLIGIALALLVAILRSGRGAVPAPAIGRRRAWMLSGIARDGHAIRISVHEADLAATKAGLNIGRDPQRCQIVIDDLTVSGRHARLSMAPETAAGPTNVVVEDLGSTNGTFVDGKRVPPGPAVPLPLGATLVLGGCRMQFNRL